MHSRLRPLLTRLIYFALTALVGMAAMNNQNNLLFWIFGVLIAAAVISIALAAAVVRSAEVRRLDPHYGAVGEPLIMRYAVTNRSRWMSVFNLRIREEPASAKNNARGWRRFMKPAG